MDENCAVNPDGSLKDASEITWVHSPSGRRKQQTPGFLKSRIKFWLGAKKATDYYNRTDLSPAYITSQCRFRTVLHCPVILINRTRFEPQQ